MKKLSVAATQIYQGHCRSPKKLKRNLFKWESRFNQLLMDWLRDMDDAKIPVTKALVDIQCSIYLNQSKRETERSGEDLTEEDQQVDWLEILGALSEASFEWKNQSFPESRTIRIKVSILVVVGNLSVASRQALMQAIGGTYLEDYETVTALVANIERKSPVQKSKIERYENFFESMVADRLKQTYLTLEEEPSTDIEEALTNHRPMSWLQSKLTELSLVYI